MRIEEIEKILETTKRKKSRMNSMERETAERWKVMLRNMESETVEEVEEVDLSSVSKKERRRLDRFHLEIGDVVEVDMGRKGILHFVGRVEGISNGKEVLFGIELMDKAMGKHNGSVHGKTYFECPPKRGCFLKSNQIRKKVVFQTPSSW